MTQDDTREAVFGMLDGTTSCLGVVVGLVIAGTRSGPHILAAALGLGIAATVGMGAGEYLSDTTRSLRLAAVMGAATFLGSVLPAVPFATGYGVGQLLAALAITVLAALLIGRVRGFGITFAILAVVAVLTVGLSALVA